MDITSKEYSRNNACRKCNIITISIAIILIAAIILPETYALDLGFLGITSSPKQVQEKTICKPSAGLAEMINDYNGTQVSAKLYDFIKKNNYSKITATVTEKKCSYQYRILVGTNRMAAIKQENDSITGLKISTAYENILAAKDAYESRDTIGLIKASMGINMPIGTRIKAIIFLKSYL